MAHDKDMEAVVRAATSLGLDPRGNRLCHLSLCVLDAVFSINANYRTANRTVLGLATSARLEPARAPVSEVAYGTHAATEQTLPQFLAEVGSLDVATFADLLGNRQLTSTRSGIPKAGAAQQYAAVLVDHGVRVLADVPPMLADHDRVAEIEHALALVPGHGSGVRVSYLWMVAGDDEHVKADRMVLRWVARAIERPVSVAEAGSLIVAASQSLCRHALGIGSRGLERRAWAAQALEVRCWTDPRVGFSARPTRVSDYGQQGK